jgi:hypothetical protein
MEKVCKICLVKKSIEEFYKRSDRKGIPRTECKDCAKEMKRLFYEENRFSIIKQKRVYNKKNRGSINRKKREYKSLYPWILHLSYAKQRCTNPKSNRFKRYYGARGIKCLLSVEETKLLWFRDKAWRFKVPTLHRKDEFGNYDFYNCEFIERTRHILIHKERRKNESH